MQLPFLAAVKQSLDQTAEKSSGNKAFWRLDIHVKGKPQLMHVNSTIGDPVQSWKLLSEMITNQYTWGGIRQFDIHFKQSPTDPEPKLFVLDLTNEQALKAMTAKPVGIAGFGEGTGLESLGIGGIGTIINLMNEKASAEAERKLAEITHKHELELLKNTRSAGDRFFELMERVLDKPGVAQKLVDKINFGGEVSVAGGSPSSDNKPQANADGSTDFNPLIRERMQQMGWAVAEWDIDYNKVLEAALILKQLPGIDPATTLKNIAEWIKANPTEAMDMAEQMKQAKTAQA